MARRLAADPVGLVFAARDPGVDLAGLPSWKSGAAACRRAGSAVLGAGRAARRAGRRPDRVRDGGNPLALLELPRGLTPLELAGGFGLPFAAPLPGRIEDSFARQLEALPDPTGRLLLMAAADPSGDPVLVRRAAGRLGIPAQAAGPAVEAGLLEFRAHVWFGHPLVRSAACRSASPQDRQAVHLALAEVTDPRIDPDRRAWHRAKAAAGPDEEVAAELESSAGRGPGPAAGWRRRSWSARSITNEGCRDA